MCITLPGPNSDAAHFMCPSSGTQVFPWVQGQPWGNISVLAIALLIRNDLAEADDLALFCGL